MLRRRHSPSSQTALISGQARTHVPCFRFLSRPFDGYLVEGPGSFRHTRCHGKAPVLPRGAYIRDFSLLASLRLRPSQLHNMDEREHQHRRRLVRSGCNWWYFTRSWVVEPRRDSMARCAVLGDWIHRSKLPRHHSTSNSSSRLTEHQRSTTPPNPPLTPKSRQ